jgi:hypothetical protein
MSHSIQVSHLSRFSSHNSLKWSVTCTLSQAGTDEVRTVKMVLTFCIPRIETESITASIFLVYYDYGCNTFSY